MSHAWGLASDLERGLTGEIPGSAARPLRSDPVGDREGGHYFATGPTDDRSQWHGRKASDGLRDRSHLWFSDATISSPRRSLTLVLVTLNARERGSRGWRWRLAARIVEIAYPLVAERAGNGDPEAVRLLPLFRWVRWRVLSEPFRQPDTDDTPTDMERGDRRPCGAPETPGSGDDRDGPGAFARGAFRGCRSLRRRTTESRVAWAENLLEYQDHPTLGRIEVEREGRLLVFADDSGRHSLTINDTRDDTDNSPSPDSAFVTWFAREFFSGRFMITEMWKAVDSRWKRLTFWAALLTTVLAIIAGCVIAPESPLGFPVDSPGGYWRLTILILFLISLTATVVSLIAGVLWTRDNERFVYPFLLRFAAGTMIGSAAVIAMRAGWIANITDPGAGHAWRSWLLLGSLVAVGFAYLLFEARIHGTSPFPTIRRAGVVWLIGMSWALTIAAIDVLVIAPIFTEDYSLFSSYDTRLWGFFVTALASLDLGIFLQVLWEDRPVTYPLGALRLSRHR